MKEENLDLWMEWDKVSTCIKEDGWSTNFENLGIFLDLFIFSWNVSINMTMTIESSKGSSILNLQYL